MHRARGYMHTCNMHTHTQVWNLETIFPDALVHFALDPSNKNMEGYNQLGIESIEKVRPLPRDSSTPLGALHSPYACVHTLGRGVVSKKKTL